MWSKVIKVGLPFMFLFVTLSAFASGGSCPSGANYTNPANPLGATVTLSSLGVTNCYFIAANGADTNNGTDESHPWAHAPLMPNCASNCAAVDVSHGPQIAGVGFIFRGGDTWHYGSNTGDYTGGTWNWNPPVGGPSGTSSNPIYVGVDKTWYSGDSWARPIFTADNSLCNGSTLGTMPDGATCTGATNTACYASGQSYWNQSCYYVSSCPYQIGTTNDMISMGNQGYIDLDNLEMTGMCLNHVGQPFAQDTYVQYGSMSGPEVFENLYIHGASHLQFAGQNSSSACTSSNVCINVNAFNGGVLTAPPGDSLLLDVVDFSDSDPGGQQLNYGGLWNVAYNIFRYSANGIPGTLHLWHDNLYEYYFEDGHSNMIESNDLAGTNAIYNNVFRHMEVACTTGCGVGLWFGPATGATDYIFNNLAYDVGNLEYLNIGGQALTVVKGNYVFFNNSWQTTFSQTIMNCQNQNYGSTLATNNYYVDNQNPYTTGCPALTTLTELCQSNTSGGTSSACPTYSDANVSPHFDQYTSSETYAYSPLASTNSTVGTGTNEYSGYCSVLSSAGLADAATACQSDTTYACSYAGNGAPPVCPARTVTARPTSAAWDIGAYEFNAQDPPPNPPTGLTAVVN